MAEGLSVAAANALLDLLGSTYSWVQLHTGAPGSAGTSNVATESTRKQVTWASATGAAKTSSADVVWPSVAGAEDFTHLTVWSASTAGTFGFSGAVTANAVAVADEFRILAGDLDYSLSTAS